MEMNSNIIQNNIDTYPDTEPETEPETYQDTEPETEPDSDTDSGIYFTRYNSIIDDTNDNTIDNDKLEEIIQLSRFNYTIYNIPKSENMVCYFCLKTCVSSEIKNCTYRIVDNKKQYDIFECPHCKIYSLISLDILRSVNKNNIREELLLRKIKKHMFF